MSTKPSKTDSLNDADIAAVFAADSSTGPSAELDALILQNAQDSHQGQTVAIKTETIQQKYAPVMATAAVLLIGFGLTPLNTSTPTIPASDASSSFSTAPTTQASSNLRQLDNSQIDPVALEVQIEELAEVSSSSLISTDAAAEPVEDSDALAEISSNANAEEITNAQTPAPRVAVAQAPAPQESSDQTNATAARADTASRVMNRLANTSTTAEVETEKKAIAEVANRAATKLNITENKQWSGFSEENASDENPAEGLIKDPARDETDANESLKKQRVRPENYQSSPLLWIIEIKHLHTDGNVELAREELKAFRQTHPNNANERLLPDELKTLKIE